MFKCACGTFKEFKSACGTFNEFKCTLVRSKK